MRLVACGAITVAFGAVLHLLLVTAAAGEHTSRLVYRSLVATRAARVSHVHAGQSSLRRMALLAQRSVTEVAQVEAVRLVTPRAFDAARMKCSFGTRFFVALRTLQRDL